MISRAPAWLLADDKGDVGASHGALLDGEQGRWMRMHLPASPLMFIEYQMKLQC